MPHRIVMIGLRDRLRDTLNDSSPEAKQRYKRSLSNLKINSFTDLNLCKAIDISLDDIYISDRQRPASLDAINSILESFKDYYVLPILLYKSDNRFFVWDGQHTCLVLLSISIHLSKTTQNKAPCVIFSIDDPSKLRLNNSLFRFTDENYQISGESI